ncbi:MAG: type II secretion system F family protein [Planctomycetaceae bacterium]|nr:type II secretion system F family protein [Planctomycetaceae bacterium]
MELLGFIFCLAFFAYFPIAGISSILLARRINDRGHQGVNPLIRIWWKLFTLFMTFCGFGLIGLSFLVVLFNQQSSLGALILILPSLILYAVTIYQEYQCFQIASALNQGDEYELPEPLQMKIQSIRILGWILLGLPLLVFLPIVISFLPLLLAFILLSSLINIFSLNKRANESELLWLLTVCVEKHLPLGPEIDAYAKTQPQKYRTKLELFSSRLYSGVSLSTALSETPGLVPQSTIVSIRIGELSNTLGIALRDAAVQTSKSLKNESKDSSGTYLAVYVTVIGTLLFTIAGYIMYWIIPKFKKIFMDFEVDLPPMTLTVINLSDFVIANFFLFLPVFSIPFTLLILIHIGNYYGWSNLRVPFFTAWFPRINTPECLRQIAQSITAQQSPQIALNSNSQYHLWSDVKIRSKSVETRINQGENLWKSLQNAKFISSSEAALCNTAERLGNLPEVLRSLAFSIEQRRNRKLRVLADFLKPVIVCSLGVVVGLFVIALFVPIIQLIYDLS